MKYGNGGGKKGKLAVNHCAQDPRTSAAKMVATKPGGVPKPRAGGNFGWGKCPTGKHANIKGMS